MRISARMASGALWMGLCVAVLADVNPNTDQAFTTTGHDCSHVVWRPEIIAQYPGIGDACQSLETRDGTDFVKFSGKVVRVSGMGRSLALRFKDGDTVTLKPPPGQRIYVEGKPTRVADLQRGQELNFYVPAGHFVAEFVDPNAPKEVVYYQIVTLTRQVAATQPSQPIHEAAATTLPKTGSELPLLGLLGGAFAALGSALGLRRRLSRGA
jgi:LPXTG-motif cell wall-anchored protein